MRLNVHRVTYGLIFALFLSSMIGCGLLSDGSKEPTSSEMGNTTSEAHAAASSLQNSDQNNQYARVPIQAFQVPEGESPSNIEILWQAPIDEKVEGFVIKMGYSPEKLESEIRLRTSEIERYNDPSFGTVFRHVVHDIPAGQPLFVAVASLVGGTPSVMSEVFELKAISNRSQQ